MRIAICDDNREDVLSLRKLLVGHEVRIFSEAAGLLSDIKKGGIQYDLYLLDIFMGESMNGIELAEKLRSRQEDAIFCFISTSDNFYREAYDLYAVQYLIKPVKEEEMRLLLDKVSKNLRRNREWKLPF